MYILEEILVELFFQVKQLKLKRVRLVDDFNEKIVQRFGFMELVEKNIFFVEFSLKEVIIVGQVNYFKVVDSFFFDEDSSDVLFFEQFVSYEFQGFVLLFLEV